MSTLEDKTPQLLIAEHDIIWHGSSFCRVQISCSPLSLFTGVGEGKTEGPDAVQALLSNSKNTAVLPTPLCSQIQSMALMGCYQEG